MVRSLRMSFVVLAVTALGLGACASADPPVFRTSPGEDDRAVLQNVAGRFAVVHAGDELPCEWIVSAGTGVERMCLLNQDLTRPAADSALVPEGPTSLLALRLEHFEAPFDETSYVLVRLTCRTVGRVCRPDVQRIASWKSGRLGVRYRKALALSPDGRTVAVLPSSSPIRMRGFAPSAPDAYHYDDRHNVGEMVLVDLATGAERNTGIAVLDDEPITWSADGRRLLMVGAETIERLTPAMREELRGREGRPDETIPVIETWNVETGAVEMLAIGFAPLWSPDQRALLFAPARFGQTAYQAGDDPTPRSLVSEVYELRDLATGARRDVALPGLVGPRGPIAFVGPRQVLYWSLPRSGTPPATTGHNSPMVGPKQMLSLKVGHLDTQAATTVYWSIDPRAQVGFNAR